jgi:hypothetical protein
VVVLLEKILTISQFLNDKSHPYALSLPLALGEGEGTIQTIKEFCETTGDFFRGMSKIMYYLLNPKQLAWMMWSGLVAHSFEICLLLCLISMMAWLIGWNKGKKIATGSILFYGVVQAINAAL